MYNPGSIIGGTCEKLTDVVYNLECNVDGTYTTDCAAELTNAINALLTNSNQDEKKVLLVSFCQSEDGDDDDTCNTRCGWYGSNYGCKCK